jgi:hypothetical protein
MKHRVFRSLGASLTILAFAGARLDVAAQPTAPPAYEPEVAAVAEDPADDTPPPVDTDAPATLVSEEKPLPANVKATGPVAEVIKLANSGLDESVMLAFATNSTQTFNLTAEEIIYLKDIGVSGSVVTAMMQRDQELKGGAAGPAAPAPPTEPPPAPNDNGSFAPSAADFSLSAPSMEPEPPNPAYAAEAPLTPPEDSEAMFYDSLSPYGNWVDVNGYGRCWQPTVVTVSPGWQPYYDSGRWVYSDCGWYWHSDYSWGWAPFHYGRWFRHSHLGWCWLPGHTWGPSWVSWRYSDRHCGWAPLPPGANFMAGVGLTYHGHRVGEHDDFGLRPGHYRFVSWDHFNDRQLRHNHLSQREVAQAYHRSVVETRFSGVNNTVINNGLPVSRVASATGRPVHTVALHQVREPRNLGGRPGGFEAEGRTLGVYRPNPSSHNGSQGQKGGHGTARPAGSGQVTPGAAPWTPRPGNPRQAANELKPEAHPPAHGATAPLVLRGPQASAENEKRPANSLVVIGRRSGGVPSAPSAQPSPSAPSAQSSPSALSAPLAARAIPAESASSARPATSAAAEAALSSSMLNRPAHQPQQGNRGNWQGTVSSSPQPAWFSGAGHTATAGHAATAPANSSIPVPRPEQRTYQFTLPTRSVEVPRYAPAQNNTPQRSFAAPPVSAPASQPAFQARPAQSPSAPAARPAAPAQPAPARSGSSNQNQGRH